MDTIYLMGFEAWGSGTSMDKYLTECRNSDKYRQGQWYCLESKSSVVSSLILYKDNFGLEDKMAGLGSIATVSTLRNKGYATKLLTLCIAELKSQDYRGVYLFSETDSSIYQKCGFASVSNTNGLMFYKIYGDTQKDSPTYF